MMLYAAGGAMASAAVRGEQLLRHRSCVAFFTAS